MARPGGTATVRVSPGWAAGWCVSASAWATAVPTIPRPRARTSVSTALKRELLDRNQFASLVAAQAAFDPWRERYNLVRPHEALALEPPSSRYAPSIRAFPEVLPAVEYDSRDQVRKVQAKGEISFRGQEYLVSRGLVGEPVALRATEGEEGRWEVYYCGQRVREIVLA